MRNADQGRRALPQAQPEEVHRPVLGDDPVHEAARGDHPGPGPERGNDPARRAGRGPGRKRDDRFAALRQRRAAKPSTRTPFVVSTAWRANGTFRSPRLFGAPFARPTRWRPHPTIVSRRSMSCRHRCASHTRERRRGYARCANSVVEARRGGLRNDDRHAGSHGRSGALRRRRTRRVGEAPRYQLPHPRARAGHARRPMPSTVDPARSRHLDVRRFLSSRRRRCKQPSCSMRAGEREEHYPTA
jgi:hypothetical protein